MYISTYGFIISARTASIDSISLSSSLWALAIYFNNEEKKIIWKSLLFWILIFLCAASSNIMTALIPLSILLPRIIRKKGIFASIFSLQNIITFILSLIIFSTTIFLVIVVLYYGLEQEDNFNLKLFNFTDTTIIFNIVKEYFREAIIHLKYVNLNYYFNKNIISVFRILLPWTPLVFVSTYYIFRDKSKIQNITFDLLKGVLCGWIIFILSAPNHWDASVILLPIIILTTADFLNSFEEEFITAKKYPRLLNIIIETYYYLAICIGAIFLSTIFIIPLWYSIIGITPPTMPLIGLPLGGALTLIIIRLDWQEAPNPLTILSSIPRRLSAIFIGFTLLMITAWAVLQPGLTELRTKKTFFKSLQEDLKELDPKEIYFFNSNVEPAFLYYLDMPESVLSSNCPTHKKSFKNFIDENRGEKVVIFCINSPTTLHYLTVEFENNQIPIKTLLDTKNAVIKEEPTISNVIPQKHSKWRAYFITIPNEKPKN
jgi:hypothetical protein